ncbi:MAG: hypothetical protein KDD35_01775, partial [Bdellovibrionales bacterium]|nr:hypothetical protein [Bdellovibrionales bacterium]
MTGNYPGRQELVELLKQGEGESSLDDADSYLKLDVWNLSLATQAELAGPFRSTSWGDSFPEFVNGL